MSAEWSFSCIALSTHTRQVDAIRKLVEDVRAELHEAISSMGLRVKFELLHDEAPQVGPPCVPSHGFTDVKQHKRMDSQRLPACISGLRHQRYRFVCVGQHTEDIHTAD